MDIQRKKLIEVALPLEAINAASQREKSIRHGHPCTLHLWWARRPLAACRAVLFSSLVDDPSSHPDRFPTEEAQEKERQRLFDIIERLVKWENTNNEQVLAEAKAEIMKSTDGNPPPVLDPFCGGGSIPLEAQRLGLKAYASDLNPVAVLITKALVEIPPKFAGRPPVNPESRRTLDPDQAWPGATGLAADVRYYGKWMRDEAERRIGQFYPKVKLPKEYGGGEATVIAWLWARTVKCPNPACGAEMPLVRSFWLSTKPGKKAWVEPAVDKRAKRVRFHVKSGEGAPPDGTMKNRAATCLVCDQSADLPYVREEAQAGRMGEVPLGIVAEGTRGRLYLSPTKGHEEVARSAKPKWKPEEKVTTPCHDVDRLPMYGMYTWGDAFTPRQLVALTTFSDLIGEARERARQDALAAGMPNGEPLSEGGIDATAYADAVATYLAFGVDRLANRATTICIWNTGGEKVEQTFGRQAIPMTWDFAEANPLGGATGSWDGSLEWVPKVLEGCPASTRALVRQLDAVATMNGVTHPLVCTDPPYYDNIGYADLADFFYVWLRRSLRTVYPDLCSTLLTPKAQELVATPYRFGGDAAKARAFFEDGLAKAFALMRQAHHPDYPLTLFYAFKQAESDGDDGNGNHVTASTGWETMLGGLLGAGLTIVGTWPMRTERDQGLKTGDNVLASSIVLVCRPRHSSAPLATRREFVAALRRELPDALLHMMEANIAPVDLAQASIGPGMAIFSRYAKVLEADGSPMSVRTALQIINQELDAHLAAQEGELDGDTRFCVAWFEQYGMEPGAFGEADVLARAKNTSAQGLGDAGVADVRGGKVRLLRRAEMPAEWDPVADRRPTVWEAVQHLIRRLDEGGEEAAAVLCSRLGGFAAEAHTLAYRLYNICERKGWADEAGAYNRLVVSWPAIQEKTASVRSKQAPLDMST